MRAAIAPGLLNQRGKVQFATIGLIAGIILAAWAAVTYGPIYLDHAEAKQVTQEMLSRMLSVNQRADVDLNVLYLTKLNELGEHEEVDATGKRTLKKGLGVTKEQITMKKDPYSGVVTVGVEYDRTFQLKPLKKWKTIHFRVFKVSDTGK